MNQSKYGNCICEYGYKMASVWGLSDSDKSVRLGSSCHYLCLVIDVEQKNGEGCGGWRTLTTHRGWEILLIEHLVTFLQWQYERNVAQELIHSSFHRKYKCFWTLLKRNKVDRKRAVRCQVLEREFVWLLRNSHWTEQRQLQMAAAAFSQPQGRSLPFTVLGTVDLIIDILDWNLGNEGLKNLVERTQEGLGGCSI